MSKRDKNVRFRERASEKDKRNSGIEITTIERQRRVRSKKEKASE